MSTRRNENLHQQRTLIWKRETLKRRGHQSSSGDSKLSCESISFRKPNISQTRLRKLIDDLSLMRTWDCCLRRNKRLLKLWSGKCSSNDFLFDFQLLRLWHVCWSETPQTPLPPGGELTSEALCSFMSSLTFLLELCKRQMKWPGSEGNSPFTKSC